MNNKAWANTLMVFLVWYLVYLYLGSGDVRLELKKNQNVTYVCWSIARHFDCIFHKISNIVGYD